MIYNKEVQTTAIETETNLQSFEEEIRQKIYQEKEAEAERVARDQDLEEESVKLDQEIEQEIRGTLPDYVLEPFPTYSLFLVRIVRGGTFQYFRST